MQTEPSKAEPPIRKRRRFQFSLRTLLIGVALVAIACEVIAYRIVMDKTRGPTARIARTPTVR
jgi:hypothetical protein